MPDLETRLLNRRLIDEETGCWLWTGSKYTGGYGHIWYPPRRGKIGTHVAAAILWMGYDLRDSWQLFVLHTCPNKHCFNPEHLYIGTPQENSDDMVADGNAYKHFDRKLTDDEVREIRALRAEGVSDASLSETFGVSRGTIYKIVQRLRYADVQEEVS